MSEVDDAMKAVEDCTAGFDEAEVLSFEVTWLRKQEAALRARVADLEAAGTVTTEWSVRTVRDTVWELSPFSLAHARVFLRDEPDSAGLVTREVRTICGPWVDAPAPSVPSGEETP